MKKYRLSLPRGEYAVFYCLFDAWAFNRARKIATEHMSAYPHLYRDCFMFFLFRVTDGKSAYMGSFASTREVLQ